MTNQIKLLLNKLKGFITGKPYKPLFIMKPNSLGMRGKDGKIIKLKKSRIQRPEGMIAFPVNITPVLIEQALNAPQIQGDVDTAEAFIMNRIRTEALTGVPLETEIEDLKNILVFATKYDKTTQDRILNKINELEKNIIKENI